MTISYDEFKKVEVRAGKILSAEKIPDTDKLLRLMVDLGEKVEVIENTNIDKPEVKIGDQVHVKTDMGADTTIIQVTKKFTSAPRQIVSGIALRYPDPSVLVGKTCMFVSNLEVRNIKGVESNGMLFAVSTPEGGFSLLETNETIPPGTLAI